MEKVGGFMAHMQDVCAGEERVELVALRDVAALDISVRALVHRVWFPCQWALIHCAAPHQQHSIMRQLATAHPDKVPCTPHNLSTSLCTNAAWADCFLLAP